MSKDTQARKIQLTLNNPVEHGATHEYINEIMRSADADYWCMADEIGLESGTYHTHVFAYTRTPRRFSTWKRRFPTAHIEFPAYGSCQENRDYILKEGKWADDPKADTSVEGTFEEYGTIPREPTATAADAKALMWECVKAGMSTYEIIESNPAEFAYRQKEIEGLVQLWRQQKWQTEMRLDLQVLYIWGATGTFKTRGIFDAHPASEICRITSYSKAGLFDSYTRGQDVIVFEEFAGQIDIHQMLNYLDAYPIALPARYNDRWACFHWAYLTSNKPLETQYRDVQESEPETWRAFLRRITKVIHHRADGSIEETCMQKGEELRDDGTKEETNGKQERLL